MVICTSVQRCSRLAAEWGRDAPRIPVGTSYDCAGGAVKTLEWKYQEGTDHALGAIVANRFSVAEIKKGEFARNQEKIPAVRGVATNRRWLDPPTNRRALVWTAGIGKGSCNPKWKIYHGPGPGIKGVVGVNHGTGVIVTGSGKKIGSPGTEGKTFITTCSIGVGNNLRTSPKWWPVPARKNSN